ncbi:MAG: glycosyltransferase [Candidatus Palauibacterales bacterium]|nr:glycosyltransferase [Candidatus Palauibacterales bacterium]
MIYVGVAARNNADTVGLLLWKIRQVFSHSTREYQLLVADDGSSDETPDVLQRYQRVLPLTIVSAPSGGPAATYAALLQEAAQRSDRHKRDTVVLIPADFRVSPEGIPELLRRIESGADLAVAETPTDGLPFTWRLLRRLTPWLLRPGIRLGGIRDVLSGCLAVRLIAARTVLREREGKPLLETAGLAARAELVARLAGAARQTTGVPLPCLPRGIPANGGALAVALQFRRLGRQIRLTPPAPRPPRSPARETAPTPAEQTRAS